MMKNLRKIFLSLFLVFSFNQASWGNDPFELEFGQDGSGVLKITRKLEESDIQNLKGLDFEGAIITRLDFSNSEMEEEQVMTLLKEILQKFSNLNEVVLKDGKINVRTVKELDDYKEDRIEDDDLIRIAKALSNHSKLQELNLSSNPLKHLNFKERLGFLDLSENNFIVSSRSYRKEGTPKFSFNPSPDDF